MFARRRGSLDDDNRVVPYTRRRELLEAERVRQVREALGLSQSRFAAALGVTRRTVIRGEQRGLELPWRADSPRRSVWEAWCRLASEAVSRAGDRRHPRSLKVGDLVETGAGLRGRVLSIFVRGKFTLARIKHQDGHQAAYNLEQLTPRPRRP